MKRRRGSGVRRRAEPSDAVSEEVAEATRTYARALPSKAQALANAVARARDDHDDRALVVARSLAHRLGGTAGCYGFAELGVAAATIDAILPFAFAASGSDAVRAWSAIERALVELDALVVRGVSSAPTAGAERVRARGS